MTNKASNWGRVRLAASTLALDYSNKGLKITNAELLRCIDVLSRYIPDKRLEAEFSPGHFDFICGWTNQILGLKSKGSLMAIPVLCATAHAYESIDGLQGAKFLFGEISKHQARGLFDQLLVTYYLSHFIKVLAVEQEKNRVDIIADANGRKLNIHVKGTDPYTKDRAQFEAFGHLTQSMREKPVVNAKGESLELTLFNGYIPGSVPKEFWDSVWAQIASNPVTTLEVSVPGGDKEPDSRLKLGFEWHKSRQGLKGTISGINAFQQARNRILEVNGAIPSSSQDIELAILTNDSARYLEIGDGVLAGRRLDGIVAIAINPGGLGYRFERSKIYLQSKYRELGSYLNGVLPESTWLC